jgi:hypothetical protein
MKRSQRTLIFQIAIATVNAPAVTNALSSAQSGMGSPGLYNIQQQKAQLAFIKNQQLTHKQHIARNQAMAPTGPSSQSNPSTPNPTQNIPQTLMEGISTAPATNVGLGILQKSTVHQQNALNQAQLAQVAAAQNAANNLRTDITPALVPSSTPANAAAVLTITQSKDALPTLWTGQISWSVGTARFAFGAQVSMLSPKQVTTLTPDKQLRFLLYIYI